MKKLILFFLLLLTAQISTACLNYYYGVDRDGNLHDVENIRVGFNTNFNTKLIVTKIKKLEQKLRKERSYYLLSDYALSLLKLGKHKESLEILATLSMHYPNDYKIASNLGTAYEINGNVDSALKYIKRGLQLNPGDHEGSEWIHVKVLETKKQLEKNPDYLSSHTVLSLTETQEKDPEVGKQINIQVRERFPFCKGPDPIMASLMIDLADCYVNTQSIEFAKSYYEIAKEYYGDRNPETDKKIKEAKNLLAKHKDVTPKRIEEGHEGDHSRTQGVAYKDLLDNNDPDNYKVNWNEITTNIDTLLSYADLTKPADLVQSDAEKNNTTEDLQLIKNEELSANNGDSLENALPETKLGENEQPKSYFIWYIGIAALILVVGFLLYRKSN